MSGTKHNKGFADFFPTMTNSFVDLNDFDKYEGTIIEKGLTKSTSTVSGKGTVASDVYYLKLEGP